MPAGITGYFIGLTVTGRCKWFKVCWLGLAVASILHGLNDWDTLNEHLGRIVIVVGSGLLLLAYAKADPAASTAGEADRGTEPVPLPVQVSARIAAATQDVEAELAALKKKTPHAACRRCVMREARPPEGASTKTTRIPGYLTEPANPAATHQHPANQQAIT